MVFRACPNPELSSFEVVEEGHAIRFHPCGITSWHPKDVEHRFCALCHRTIGKETAQGVVDERV